MKKNTTFFSCISKPYNGTEMYNTVAMFKAFKASKPTMDELLGSADIAMLLVIEWALEKSYLIISIFCENRKEN